MICKYFKKRKKEKNINSFICWSCLVLSLIVCLFDLYILGMLLFLGTMFFGHRASVDKKDEIKAEQIGRS